MTFLDFIKSKLLDDSEFGDLAKDAVNDPEFPVGKPDHEIIGYLNSKTEQGGTNRVLKSVINEFKMRSIAQYDDLYNIEKYVIR